MSKLLAVIALVVAGIFLGASAANAEGSSATTIVGQGHKKPLSLVDQAYFQDLAKDFGVPYADALKMYQGSDEFSEVVSRLESEQGFVSGTWTTETGYGIGSLVFNRELSADTRALLESSSLTFSVKIDESIPSADLLYEVQDRLTALLANLAPGVELTVVPLSDVGVLEVALADVSQDSIGSQVGLQPDMTAALSLISDIAKRLESDTEVRIVVKQSGSTMVFEDQAAMAGGLSDGANCTGGFLVGNSIAWGISTTAHCMDTSVAYNGVQYSGNFYVLSPSEGDVAWWELPGARPNIAMFQSAPGIFTQVTGQGNPAKGTAVCHFGITSGKACSTVLLERVSVNGFETVTNTYKSLGAMWVTTQNVSAGGDSGGPWYSSSIARGIHYGRVSYGGVLRSLFSRIGAINLLNAYPLGSI
jgi:streptogrisin C